MALPRIGETAPTFTLMDQDGKAWSLESQLGRPVVLYFYPADHTAGCTAQACEVRDNWSAFEAQGVVVVGISPDDVESHRDFAAGQSLPHTLLADPDLEVLKAYGAWGKKTRGGVEVEGVIRSSIVIDATGAVADVFDSIRPEDQARLTLDSIRKLAISQKGEGPIT